MPSFTNYKDMIKAKLNNESRLAVFSERTTLRSLYAISRPSVVCLLSVTLVHPTQAV